MQGDWGGWVQLWNIKYFPEGDEQSLKELNQLRKEFTFE